MAMSSAIITMSHFEFHNICDTKLQRIGQRITCYQEVPGAHTLPATSQLASTRVRLNFMGSGTGQATGELQAPLAGYLRGSCANLFARISFTLRPGLCLR